MTEKSHIVVVDDDLEICRLLKDFLSKNNYQVTTVSNPDRLYKLMGGEIKVDLLILDLMLPKISGMDICKELRKQNNNIPVIMLTALTDDMEKILGLEIGADDYLTKPFNPRELLARIKAVQRRLMNAQGGEVAPAVCGKILTFSEWALNTSSRQLFSPDNIEIGLSSRSYDLLLVFLERPQRVLSRDQLLSILSNRTSDPFDRSIDVQISRLRIKLRDDPREPKMIKTIRSTGYMFASKVVRS